MGVNRHLMMMLIVVRWWLLLVSPMMLSLAVVLVVMIIVVVPATILVFVLVMGRDTVMIARMILIVVMIIVAVAVHSTISHSPGQSHSTPSKNDFLSAPWQEWGCSSSITKAPIFRRMENMDLVCGENWSKND